MTEWLGVSEDGRGEARSGHPVRSRSVATPTTHRVLALQQTVGNRAVRQLLRRSLFGVPLPEEPRIIEDLRIFPVGEHNAKQHVSGEADNSRRFLDRAGLRALLTMRARGALSPFEESLIGTWGDDGSQVLRPLIQLTDDVGLVGYILDYGGSGDRQHVVYTRRGDVLRQTRTEAPLENMGLGPIDWALLLTGAAGLGKYAVAKFAAKRLVAAEAAKVAASKVFLSEAEAVLAVIQDGKIIASSRNLSLSHELFVKRSLGWTRAELPAGVEVVTIGKHQGEIGAILSRTFHSREGFASQAAQEAAKAAFR